MSYLEGIQGLGDEGIIEERLLRRVGEFVELEVNKCKSVGRRGGPRVCCCKSCSKFVVVDQIVASLREWREVYGVVMAAVVLWVVGRSMQVGG